LIDEPLNIRSLEQRNIPSIDPKRAVPSYVRAAITLQFASLKMGFAISKFTRLLL